MKVGVTVDLHFGFEPADVASLGVSFVRFPLWQDGFDYNPFVEGLKALGVESVGVVDDVTITSRIPAESWLAFYQRLGRMYPSIHRFQILNEVDGLPGGESGPHPPEYVNAHLWAARRALPLAYLIAPGLVQADAAYAKALRWNHMNSLAFHPYGQRPNLPPEQASEEGVGPDWGVGNVQDLYAIYAPIIRRYGLSVWVTEFGGPGDLFDSEHQRAIYHSEMLTALRSLGADGAAVYCYSDLMRPQEGGMGLLGADGAWKESAAAVAGAADPRSTG